MFFKWRMVLAVGLAVFFCASLNAWSAPPPDNSSPDDAHLTDSIFAIMDNVDDVGMVIVWNGDGARTVGMCEWSGGNGGSETVALDDNVLNEGVNYVIFVCFNKKYVGTGLFAGGKWSYDFKLKRNGRIVWEKSGFRRENFPAIAYWKIFKMVPSSTGSVSISEDIDRENKKLLQKFIDELEGKLVRNADVARPF